MHYNPGNIEGKWYHKGVELKSNGKYTVHLAVDVQNLTVKDVTKEDQGEYSFVVGREKDHCRLKMKRKPPPPFQPIASIAIVLLIMNGHNVLFSPIFLAARPIAILQGLSDQKSARVTLFSLKLKGLLRECGRCLDERWRGEVQQGDGFTL